MNGGTLRIDTELMTNKFDKQYDKVKTKIENLEKDNDRTRQKLAKAYDDYYNASKTTASFRENKTLTDNEKELLQIEEKRKSEYEKLADLYDRQLASLTQLKSELRSIDYAKSLSSAKMGLNQVKNISYNEGSIGNLAGTPQITNWAVDGAVAIKNIKGDTAIIADNFKDIHSKLQDTNNSLNETSNKIKEVSKSSGGVSAGFSKGIGSIKKMAFALLSIRGIYGLLRRASSNYVQNDEHLSKQLQANWTALGAVLSPVIEAIVGAIKKAVTAVLYFMQCLTGVNYIAKANNAIIKSQTKSQKALNKERDKFVASFDEMNVVQDNKNSDTDSGLDKGTLFDIGDLGEDTRKIIEKIAEKLKPVYEMIKKIIDWGKKNPNVIAGILGGIAILGTLAKIIGVLGTGATIGSGLAGILGVLLAIVAIGTIVICIKAIYDSVKEANKAIDDAKQKSKDFVDANKNNNDELTKMAKNGELTSEQIGALSDKFKIGTTSSMTLAKQYKNQADDGNYLKTTVKKMTGEYDMLTSHMYDQIVASYDNLSSWGELYDQGLLNEDQTRDYEEALVDFFGDIDIGNLSVEELTKKFGLNKDQAEKLRDMYDKTAKKVGDLGTTTDDTGKKIDGVGDSIVDVNKKELKVKVTDNKVSGLLSSVKSIFDTLGKITGKQWVFKLGYNLVEGGVNKVKSAGEKVSSLLSKLGLATGGIVNNPGRGVSLGNVVAGEAGREGVIPLTDPQAMSQLGYEIGRHIVVDLTNITTLNSKEIAREQKKIDGQQSFARNGRA